MAHLNPGNVRGQGIDNTRILSQNLFVAGATNPVQNPRQRGFGSSDRFDELVLCFDGTATEPGGQATMQFDTQAQYESFYGAFIAQIRLNSGALPWLIEQQTGIQISRSVLADGIIATGLPDLGVSVATPGGVFTFSVRLSIPWVSIHQARVQAAHAPYMGYLFDGGLAVTQGNGVIVNNVTLGVPGLPYPLDATAQFTARVAYTSGLPIMKVAPYSYMRRNFGQRNANPLPDGVYYRLGSATEVPSALPFQAIDSGVRLYIDGEEVLPFNEAEPTTQVQAWLEGLPGRGANVSSTFALLGDAAAIQYLPIINNPVNSHEALRPESDRGMVIDFGLNLNPAQIILGKRVPFMDEVGQGVGECASNCPLQTLPYPGSRMVGSNSRTKDGSIKGIRTAPRRLLSNDDVKLR